LVRRIPPEVPGTDCLILQKAACKGISKNQSEPLNGKIFAAYPVFGGDKLCRDAVCPFFINYSCNAGFECISSKIKEKILTAKW